jgi:hypothetical protein
MPLWAQKEVKVSHHRNYYYWFYTDENGNEIKELGRWDHAEAFNLRTGYAKVVKNSAMYLLD